MELFLRVLVEISYRLILIFLIYLVAVFPRLSKRKKCRELLVPYAHRGLHDVSVGIPENSIPAFERAVEHGFGIELDIQLSKDKTIMVFHDYTLKRICGIDKALSELDSTELSAISLSGTEYKIPTFEEMLEVVAGKVPLLIELKGENNNTELCDYVCKRLDGYEGAFCIESFNPMYIRAIKKLRPEFIRGQLVTNLFRDKWEGNKILGFFMSNLIFNLISRPDFIAFNQKYTNSFSVVFSRVLLRTPSFVWTIKNKEEFHYFSDKNISPIFEGFIPNESEMTK